MSAATLVGRSAAPAFGTTTATPTTVAGVAQYDVAFIYMIAKRTTAAVLQARLNQTGWSTAISLRGGPLGGGTVGSGTGPLTVAVFAKEADASGLGTLPAISALSPSVIGCSMSVWRPAAGERITWWGTTGADTTAATSYAAAGAINPGFTVDDWCEVATGLTLNTITFNAFSMAATGCTFGAMSEVYDATSGAVGNLERFGLHVCQVTAGTATGVPTFSATTSAATGSTGGSLILRIRSTPLTGLVNLSPNPGAGVDTTGWSTSGTLSRVTGVTGAPRTTAAQGTPANAGNFRTARFACTPGVTYITSAYVKVGAAVSYNRRINWYTSGGSLVSSTAQVNGDYNTTTVWNREIEIATAPGTAATGEIEISPSGTVSNIQMTAVMAAPISEVVPYADGSSPGWVWDGATDNSTSQASSGPVEHQGAVVMAGAGALTADATLIQTSVVSVDTASIDIDYLPPATITHEGAATLAGAGAFTAGAVTTDLGAATLAGTGALTAGATTTDLGAAVLAGQGALAAAAVREQLGVVTLSATGALAAAAEVIPGAVEHAGAAVLAGAGSLTAAATVVSYDHTGWLYAGTATEVSGTWEDEANAIGPGTGSSATWTTTTAGSAVLELAGFGAQAGIPAGSVIGPVQVLVRHAEDPEVTEVTAQPYLAGTPHGSPQTLTVDTAVHEDTVTITDLDHADLADLRVRVTAVRT